VALIIRGTLALVPEFEPSSGHKVTVTFEVYFPQELQSYIDIRLGIGSTTKNNEASKALAAFLLSDQNDAALKTRGVDRLK
jgi:ABC-type molybdate transport system substrate-binding protein